MKTMILQIMLIHGCFTFEMLQERKKRLDLYGLPAKYKVYISSTLVISIILFSCDIPEIILYAVPPAYMIHCNEWSSKVGHVTNSVFINNVSLCYTRPWHSTKIKPHHVNTGSQSNHKTAYYILIN